MFNKQKNRQKFANINAKYSQRLEASLPADELRVVLVEPTELATQRLTFDDFLHGDAERDLDLPRLLQSNHETILLLS